jgi:MAF protein
MRIILASTSPRRRELMDLMGLRYEILAPEGEEVFDPALSPQNLVQHLARQKGENVAARTDGDVLVIAADTVVTLGSRILGKPRDRTDAIAMLASLSGRVHSVFTGVCMFGQGKIVVDSEETLVHMRPLSETEIAAYVDSGEPMDKAGAYGIQGRASLFIPRIEGDYFNVMGFPVCRIGQMLAAHFGLSLSSR